MGMPIIEGSDVERSQAITDLIVSVALEQAALSHILNAEGEKLQAFVAMAEGDSPIVTPEMLLEANESVTDLVTSVSNLESHLQAKLALFADTTKLNFYFMKRNRDTDLPLSGAVFELTQGEITVAVATSDTNGIVLFQNILPGVYELHEESAPPGFTPDAGTYPVVANGTLDVTINNIPAEDFVLYNMPDNAD